jgi:hypothetical protein
MSKPQIFTGKTKTINLGIFWIRFGSSPFSKLFTLRFRTGYGITIQFFNNYEDLVFSHRNKLRKNTIYFNKFLIELLKPI